MNWCERSSRDFCLYLFLYSITSSLQVNVDWKRSSFCIELSFKVNACSEKGIRGVKRLNIQHFCFDTFLAQSSFFKHVTWRVHYLKNSIELYFLVMDPLKMSSLPRIVLKGRFIFPHIDQTATLERTKNFGRLGNLKLISSFYSFLLVHFHSCPSDSTNYSHHVDKTKQAAPGSRWNINLI